MRAAAGKVLSSSASTESLWAAKALMYKGAEGSRVHALDTAWTKKGSKIENGIMKVSGNKTITLQDLRTARKRTLKPVLKL